MIDLKDIEEKYTFWNCRDSELFKKLQTELTPPNNISTWDKKDHISHLMLQGIFYETHTLLQFYDDLPSKGAIFDIGAMIGNHQIMFNQLYPNREIIGFEASPFNYYHLHKNTINYQNTLNFCLGLGEEDKIEQITHFYENMGGSGIRDVSNLRHKEEDIIPIIIKPLDNFNFDQPVSLVKIDVEGYEMSVIKGAHKTFEKYSPVIWLEDFKLEKDYDSSATKYLIDELGYEVINKSECNYLLKKQN